MIQDLTPLLMPEVHTAGNIGDFEDYVRYAVHHATRIATVSASSQRDIINHLPVYPAHVHVIPMQVHPRFMERAEPPSEELRARLGIAGHYAMTVGTIEPRKNLRRLVDSFAQAATGAECGDLELVIAGPQGWDSDLPSYVAAHACRSRIRLLGFVPPEDLPSLYAGASLFVYPSLYEGFGRPVLEAMCCGCLVLTSRVRAMPEVLGDAGLYFDTQHTDEVTLTLKEALRMRPERVAQLRGDARQRAQELLAHWAAAAPLPSFTGWS